MKNKNIAIIEEQATAYRVIKSIIDDNYDKELTLNLINRMIKETENNIAILKTKRIEDEK